jgi:hypothetical protein
VSASAAGGVLATHATGDVVSRSKALLFLAAFITAAAIMLGDFWRSALCSHGLMRALALLSVATLTAIFGVAFFAVGYMLLR